MSLHQNRTETTTAQVSSVRTIHLTATNAIAVVKSSQTAEIPIFDRLLQPQTVQSTVESPCWKQPADTFQTVTMLRITSLNSRPQS